MLRAMNYKGKMKSHNFSLVFRLLFTSQFQVN